MTAKQTTDPLSLLESCNIIGTVSGVLVMVFSIWSKKPIFCLTTTLTEPICARFSSVCSILEPDYIKLSIIYCFFLFHDRNLLEPNEICLDLLRFATAWLHFPRLHYELFKVLSWLFWANKHVTNPWIWNYYENKAKNYVFSKLSNFVKDRNEMVTTIT